jgi:hypothetical protein
MRNRRPATSTISLILATLKLQFKYRQIKYRDIANTLRISEITVKRYLAGRGLTVAILERLALVSGLTLFDLIDHAKRQCSAGPLSPSVKRRREAQHHVRDGMHRIGISK